MTTVELQDQTGAGQTRDRAANRVSVGDAVDADICHVAVGHRAGRVGDAARLAQVGRLRGDAHRVVRAIGYGRGGKHKIRGAQRWRQVFAAAAVVQMQHQSAAGKVGHTAADRIGVGRKRRTASMVPLNGAGVAAAETVPLPVTVTVSVGLTAQPPTLLESIVTAPVCAKALPLIVAPALMVMLA